MRTVGVFEAKTHFSALINSVTDGETIVITKNGEPVARLVPISATNDDAVKSMERILSTRGKLRGVTVRELIEEGRHR
jgi:prevent-host-death family protein